ncbi:MAG: HAD family hydrolase [Treponema sp.]|nr:HAD family hydrolase [Treponema sp.]
MNTKNFGEIKAVAFDIDGTLYETWRLNIRLPIHFLSHLIFFAKYGKARKVLREEKFSENFTGSFYEEQIKYMAKALHITEAKATEKLEKIVYSGLKSHFVKIKPCKNALECIKAFKEAGFKIALLSDFPPEQKGELWGIKPFCDEILGTEECGALKPSPVPFSIMAKNLGIKPEEILYVGNSYKYDVVGSKAAGMKAAWFTKKKPNKAGISDFVFRDYLDLMHAVLEK